MTSVAAQPRAGFRITITPPDEEPDAFQERLALRAWELAEDLRLPAVPELAWTKDQGTALRLAGRLVAVPLPAPSDGNLLPPAKAVAAAERAAAALFRHRWALLRHAGLPPRPALRDAMEGGLDLTTLLELHAATPDSDDALAYRVAERYPPSAALLLHRHDLPTPEARGFLREATQTVADAYGLPVPPPSLHGDAGLDLGRGRLRLGRVRGPVQPEPWPDDADKREPWLRGALLRHAPGLFDVGSLLTLLLDPDRVPPTAARAALDAAKGARRLTTAARELLASGIGLVDPALLCEAATAPAVVLQHPTERVVALPGVLVLAPAEVNAPELMRRLRAGLVPAHLLRRAANDRGALPFRWLGDKTAKLLRDQPTVPATWVARLAAECSRRIVGRELLITPADLGHKVRDLLADALPDLLIVTTRELPPERPPYHRGTIEVGEAP